MHRFKKLQVFLNLIVCISSTSVFSVDSVSRCVLAAVLKLAQDEVEVYALESQRLDIWTPFSANGYQRATAGEYFPIIPLANGNIGMVTTIQNSKAGREGFTWWELVLNKF